MSVQVEKKLILLSIQFGFLLFLLCSCTHDPFDPEEIIQDQGDISMTDSIDMGGNSGMNQCLPDIIYFERQVLPILKSNCAFSGCHDANSAEDGVILDNFKSVIETGRVIQFDAQESDLVEVLIDDDINDRMPPDPRPALSQEQIQIITTWINQGAVDLMCDDPVCNPADATFAMFVSPLISDNCKGCHSNNSPSGGINLDGYDNIKSHADNGKLFGAISYAAGFSPMPQNQGKLDDCSIDKIKTWIDNGAPNN